MQFPCGPTALQFPMSELARQGRPRAVCGATAVVGSVLSHELDACDCWSARSRPTHMGPAGSRAPHAAAAAAAPCWAPRAAITAWYPAGLRTSRALVVRTPCWVSGYTAVMAFKLLPSDPKPRSFLSWVRFFLVGLCISFMR